MKKTILIFLISFFGHSSFAQSKADEVDLNNIKRFFTRLKSTGINTKEELIWRYTYGDSSETTLTKLGKVLEKENLKMEGVAKSKKVAKRYTLTVSEIKEYNTPESLNERVNYLNSIAQIFKIIDQDAIIGAETQKKESTIDSYKKRGKKGK